MSARLPFFRGATKDKSVEADETDLRGWEGTFFPVSFFLFSFVAFREGRPKARKSKSA